MNMLATEERLMHQRSGLDCMVIPQVTNSISMMLADTIGSIKTASFVRKLDDFSLV